MEVLAIVPCHLAGENLTRIVGGAAGLHRIGLIPLAASLARPGMAERGLAPLGALGLEAVAARVAHEALHAHELDYFGPVAASRGFARALSKTLAELRLARIEPHRLGSGGAAASDLSRLLARYQGELAARSLADLAGILELASETAKQDRHPLLDLPLLRLDVPLETRSHREFFQAIARRAPEVLEVELTGEGGEADEEGLSDSASTPLQHLRRYVFSPAPPASGSREGFDIFSTPGEGLEAVEIARRILHLARQGVNFDGIAILLRNPERYQPMIEDALRRASIPAWFSRGISRPNPAGRAFLALLACAAEKCSASRFAEYLSFGQVPSAERRDWVGSEDELLSPGGEPRDLEVEPQEKEGPSVPAPTAWEKLLTDAAVIGGRERWERRLKGLEREFELRLPAAADETQRSHLVAQIERLRSLVAFAMPLIERLDSLPRTASWSDWLESLRQLAEASLREPEGVLAVLAELEPMGEVGPVSVEEAAEVLSERLRFLRAEPPARRWGRVFIGSIDEIRGCEFPVVFLPGLAEGLFPQRAFEDPLLLDAARKSIAEDLPLRQDRNLEERERLRLALAAARDRFIASYPRMDVAEARPRVPSFYALELPRALDGALPSVKEFEERARSAAPARLNWPAPRNSGDAIDDAEYDIAWLGEQRPAAARFLMEANPNLARSLRARWQRWRPEWKKPDGLIVGDPAALEALATHGLTARAWSPSSLEQFAACPYKFALHGVYRLRPRDDAAPLQQLDPLTRGALFHEVQYSVLGELKEAGLLPLDGDLHADQLGAALAACDRALDRIASEYGEKLAPAIPRVWKSEIEDLRTDLRGWLQHMARDDSDWEPLHFEFSFGLERCAGHDSASTTQEVELDEGIRLRGSIDLIERHIHSGALRVTDHKSGKAPERIPQYVGGGRALQPLLYSLAAERVLNAKVESGRLFYATQRGGYRSVAIRASEQGRGFLHQVLHNVNEAICSGFLPPAPEKDACGRCDYRPVCGPYEELRFHRHKNRREEKLEPLIQIRGFA